MATETKTVGTSSRDYSTMTAAEADISNTTFPSANTDVVFDCYNDSAFDELCKIQFTASNVLSVTFQAASGEEHDGTAGTGVRNVWSTSRAYHFWVDVDTDVNLYGIECDGNGYEHASGSAGTIRFTNTINPTAEVARLIVHDFDFTTEKFLSVMHAANNSATNPITFSNCIIYNITATMALTGNKSLYGIQLDGSGVFNAYNCTVWNVAASGCTGAFDCSALGFLLANAAGNLAKNNASFGAVGYGSGLSNDYGVIGSATAVTNVSGDTTGTAGLTSKTDTDQFVSLTGGAEDFHLKSGADCIGAGTDLGAGTFALDIDGYDRHAGGVTWDCGADQRTSVTLAVSPATGTWTAVAPTNVLGTSPSPASGAWSGVAPTFSFSHTPTPATAVWSVVAPASLVAASVSPGSALWSGVAPAAVLGTSPAPATVTWTVVAPAFSYTYTATPGTAIWTGITPVAMTAVTPSPATGIWTGIAPTFTITHAPAPAAGSWSIVSPLVHILGDTLVKRALTGGYAIAGGHTAAPTADQQLNPSALLAALRAGWTLAEAVAVASPMVNSNVRVIGDPLATLPTPLQGYNLYRRELVDGDDTLIAVIPAGSASYTLTGLPANDDRFYHIKAVSRLGREDDEPINRRKRQRVATDDSANVVDPVPNPPLHLTLTRGAAGSLTVGWGYIPNGQAVAPSLFNLYVATGNDPFDFSTPTHQVRYGVARTITKDLGAFADGTRVRVAIGSVSADGDEQPIRPTTEATADATAPDAPATLDVEVTNA